MYFVDFHTSAAHIKGPEYQKHMELKTHHLFFIMASQDVTYQL